MSEFLGHSGGLAAPDKQDSFVFDDDKFSSPDI